MTKYDKNQIGKITRAQEYEKCWHHFPPSEKNVNKLKLTYLRCFMLIRHIFTRVLSLSECGNNPISMVKRKLTNADGKILTNVDGIIWGLRVWRVTEWEVKLIMINSHSENIHVSLKVGARYMSIIKCQQQCPMKLKCTAHTPYTTQFRLNNPVPVAPLASVRRPSTLISIWTFVSCVRGLLSLASLNMRARATLRGVVLLLLIST